MIRPRRDAHVLSACSILLASSSERSVWKREKERQRERERESVCVCVSARMIHAHKNSDLRFLCDIFFPLISPSLCPLSLSPAFPYSIYIRAPQTLPDCGDIPNAAHPVPSAFPHHAPPPEPASSLQTH